MKGVKGKLLKKLKTIKTITYLKPERILQVSAFDGYLYTSPPKPPRAPLAAIEEEPKKQPDENVFKEQEPEIIDVSELMKDLEEEDIEFDDKENFVPRANTDLGEIGKLKARDDGGLEENQSELMKDLEDEDIEFDDKENIIPRANSDLGEIGKLKARDDGGLEENQSEIDVSTFRRPELNSITLFDPNLLAAFEQAVTEVKLMEAQRRSRIESIGFLEELGEEEKERPLKTRKIDQILDPITEFEEKCPPGGGDSIVLYTTGLRGIRKTFEDCQKVRSLLENLRIVFFERDVSMHSEYREELWRVLGEKMVPPRLFIKGRYIGGAEEVLSLHEQGKLKPLMEGIPIDGNEGPCEGCVGVRFIVCFNCNGSRKIMPEGDGEAIECAECNENGLIVCPFCC